MLSSIITINSRTPSPCPVNFLHNTSKNQGSELLISGSMQAKTRELLVPDQGETEDSTNENNLLCCFPGRHGFPPVRRSQNKSLFPLVWTSGSSYIPGSKVNQRHGRLTHSHEGCAPALFKQSIAVEDLASIPASSPDAKRFLLGPCTGLPGADMQEGGR